MSKAKEWAPVSVVVIDASDNVLCSMRMDGCPPVAYPKYAHAKATTAVSLGISSRKFRDKYIGGPEKVAQGLSMIATMQGKICCFPGSVLLSTTSDGIVGAVGVSGASSDQDEFMALSAVREFDFITDPTSSPLD
jgi:uncharacterized protein GlcG (DUF336 family)